MAIEAVWSVSLDTDCPNCKEYVNLLEYADFWDGKSSLQIGQEVHNLEVYCPECSTIFKVDTVY